MPFIVQDFVPKLKAHILSRIKEMLSQDTSTMGSGSSWPPAGLAAEQGSEAGSSSLFFKSDRLYQHNLARFNYTTYNVRRSQDVVNPKTPHRYIMLLATDGNDGAAHPFLYARVLGIFHANVIYTGEGSLGYTARRVEFLWVRWLERDVSRSYGWADMKLDLLRFPPMASEGVFGFVDPRDVLRGCHVVPAFKAGKARWLDGIGLSRLAQDALDWALYSANRYVPVLRTPSKRSQTAWI